MMRHTGINYVLQHDIIIVREKLVYNAKASCAHLYNNDTMHINGFKTGMIILCTEIHKVK